MTHHVQPSKTSCGPTCVAMLADVQVLDVIAKVKSVRMRARASKRTHGTNVGEVVRLLQSYGLTLSRRYRGTPDATTQRRLLRIEKRSGGNWHWAVCQSGVVFDPLFDHGRTFDDYAGCRLSFYDVEEKGGAR